MPNLTTNWSFLPKFIHLDEREETCHQKITIYSCLRKQEKQILLCV